MSVSGPMASNIEDVLYRQTKVRQGPASLSREYEVIVLAECIE
jgi:hypothetical protein